MLEIREPYQAFCLDQAIAALGNGIVARLEDLGKTDKKMAQLQRKMDRELRILLQLEDEPSERRYRSPG